jgi:hypothetical protein
MASGYSPLYIKGNQTGLVQDRVEVILPDDAYPKLQNAIIWREQIRRKQGFTNIVSGEPASSRLSRRLTLAPFTTTASGAGPFPVTYSFSLVAALITGGQITAGETTAEITPGTTFNGISIVIGAQTLTDTTGTGVLTIGGAGAPITAAFMSYSTGKLILTVSGALGAVASTFTGNYYPSLPVMGLRTEEAQDSAFDITVAFDMVYAYVYDSTSNTWQEFLPGTRWTGTNSQFMWTTNFFRGVGNFKIFWATNYNDPIRFTNGQPGSTWFDFTPQTNAGGGTLTRCKAMLPFRGRLVVFNTIEAGSDGGTFTNRIRWSAIGTPFTQAYGAVIASFNVNAWRDDIRGQGGFLDMPTSEDITAVGFVRDNVVIYCERSTWQLRYTGRSIAPFQIERVNSELGVESLFSAVQFDTSLVGIGDKGIVECDSYKSERIDVKIPDLTFTFNNANNGVTRVHGIRDFVSRMAYWTYPENTSDGVFPNKRLAYNYENDSWGIYDDSFTCFGTFQTAGDRTWINTEIPWIECNFTWIAEPSGDPVVVAGNQQGFVVVVANQLDGFTTNDPSLSISAITGNTTTPTVITSYNHNLITGQIIEISGIISGSPFDNLNGNVFFADVKTADTFALLVYNPVTDQFSSPQLDPPNSGYLGSGVIQIRDNFNVTSKKFNFLDEGQSIQIGFLDVLMDATGQGAVSLNVYIDYDDDHATNTLPANVVDDGVGPDIPDSFFNTIIPTSQSPLSGVSGSKFWQRVFCPTRGNLLTLQYTFSNAQMAGVEQTEDVQIDAQILWIRRAGRLTQP